MEVGAIEPFLHGRFPAETRNAVAGAVKRARAMLGSATDLAFVVRAESLSLEQATATLASEWPGFPRHVYSDALGRGMFTSR
jgi:hypothetical protein